MPTIRDSETEQNQTSSTTRRRGLSASNSLHPVSTNGSRGRAGSVSSTRQRKSVKIERTPTGFGVGMRKRTTTWNLNGPTALGRQGTGFRRRGTLNLGGASSAIDVGGDSRSAAGFTLAGPGNPLDTMIANQPYIDPGYVDLNPAYEVAPNARPVWGLAKPLPHVVRAGMIPTRTEVLEQAPAQLRHEQQAHEEFDLEAGRVQSTMNPHKISSALQTAQQDREFRLLRTYTGQSAFGGHGRRRSSVSSAHVPRHSVASHDSNHLSPNTINANNGKLASVVEQPTPDENEHPNEKGWIVEDTHAVTPVHDGDDDKMNDDWIEDPDEIKPYDPELDEIHNLHTQWSVIRLRFREPLAEFLAVTCQLTLGFCADLAVLTGKGSSGNGVTTDWAWGLASMAAIYISGGISGAHLNPAISCMLWIFRGFPFGKIKSYAFAQILGAFVAALISFGLFRTSIFAYAETHNLADSGTASAFITYPRNSWVDPATAFFTEFVGTTILAVVVLALGDDSNAPPGAGMNAFIMGLVIVVLSMAFGSNTGLASKYLHNLSTCSCANGYSAVNPARDIGPRLALLALGYGTETTFGSSYWFWGSWCAPIAGALCGGFVYDATIFGGSESPVNYSAPRLKRALKKKKNKLNRRFQSIAKGIHIRRPKYASDEWRFEVDSPPSLRRFEVHEEA